MSNIDLITSKVNAISTSLTTWNKIVIFLIFFTAFVAALYFVASYVAHKKAVQLDKAKDELIQIKDREQALQITKVKTDSEEQIAYVKTEAEKQIALLNAETAKANEKAEAERLERMRLEAEIAPRTIEQRQSAKELLQFLGINVIIESLAESEPWRVAGQIAWALNNAKWNVLPNMKRFLDATPFFDGVTIEINVGARSREDRSSEAADALVSVLTKNKIPARIMPSSETLPLNTIKIRVGLKPTEYFQRNRKDMEYGNMLYK